MATKESMDEDADYYYEDDDEVESQTDHERAELERDLTNMNKEQMPTTEYHTKVIEARKAWVLYGDSRCQSYIHGICDTYKMGREDYKAFLRREIEKWPIPKAQRKYLLNMIDTVSPE